MLQNFSIKPVLTALALTLGINAFGADSPKREMRSTWFTTVWAIDWPTSRGTTATTQKNAKAELDAYLNNFQALNLNGICFQVRGMADAFYKSSLEPWSSYISGTRGVNPGWDPLAYAVEQCHNRGLECYAWVNPFRHSTGNSITSSTSFDKEWINKGWLLQYSTYTVFNPAVPEARQHILDVIAEILDNYAIDGMLFDDYFYPNNIPENSTAGDWDLYKASGTTMSIGDWRRENINSMIREIQALINSKRPDIRFGISPAGVAGASASKYGLSKPAGVTSSDWQYGTIYSDPLAWLSDGSIDFISPQIYWFTTHSMAPFGPLCKWWSDVADHFGRHFYASHSLSALSDNNTADNRADYTKQINYNREYATPTTVGGSLFYSSKHFKTMSSGNIGYDLANGVFANKALIPVTSWKNGPTYNAPQGASVSGSTLKWSAVSNGKAIIRYTVYAVPLGVEYTDAMAKDGDGIDAKYLLGVTYNPSFTLPSDKTSGYWYAVHVYDGYGREHTPAFINYTVNNSAKPSLISPVGGATVAWSQSFSWADDNDAEFKLEISDSESFSSILINKTVTSQSVTLDLKSLEPESRFFWRVTATEDGCLPTVSDVASFRTGSYPQASVVTLLYPVNGIVCAGTVDFSWTASAGASVYTLQVSDTRSFDNVSYSSEVNTNKTQVGVSAFGLGTHYWRVIASGPGLSSSTSDIGSFVINEISTGTYEPGYVIKRDPASYPAVSDLHVENIWVRSANLPYNNLQLEENGSFSRGMVAVNDMVYVSRRSENSSGAKLYLDCYSGSTGERIKSLLLTNDANDAQIGYFPLNNVCKDSKGTVVIFNLTLNASTTPLVMHCVDLNTGWLTKVASVNTSGTSRIDHASVYGDVAGGNFTIFGAGANTTKTITAWTFARGKLSSTKTYSASSFSPSDASGFGIAPRVFPISASEVLVNGGAIHPSHYVLSGSSASLVHPFSEFGNSNMPLATDANGICRFTFNGKRITLYPYSTCGCEKGYQFAAVSTDDDNNLSSAVRLALFPSEGLGMINSTTMSTPIDVVVSPDGKVADMYVYAVGNGLAAYRLSDKNSSYVDALDKNDTLKVSVDGRLIRLSAKADKLTVYNSSGMVVAVADGCDCVELPSAGIYIVIADGISSKVIVR